MTVDPVLVAPEHKEEIKSTTCYMCACRCGIDVTIRDGQVRYIEGNPNHPLNQGVICAKGAAGIMKQYSPARLTQPLRRRKDSERGQAHFEPISWEETYDILEKRLSHIRATDPKKFALFTGRDQMQALTGLFARQFGTPNYAAHGGFCSVNMAAGMIYTIGGSFWEFGGPDLEQAKLFVMIGTAEDHHSNPMKVALSKFKRRGGRFISINPVRTGYSAIADEWIPIKPGTDGALLLALCHVLLRDKLFDESFVREYTNGGYLVNDDPQSPQFGLVIHNGIVPAVNPHRSHSQLWWDLTLNAAISNHAPGCEPALSGRYHLPDGTPVRPAFALLQERLESYTPAWAESITGISAQRIEALAIEMGTVALKQKITLPIKWTDSWGKKHDSITGNPVAFHAMRGLAAHSNGFQSIRSLSILMSLLGTIDRPGGFRHKAPYPRGTPPVYARNPMGPEAIKPNTPLAGAPLGFPSGPDELFIDKEGQPLRLDKAFSWEYPLAIHGMMHNVITNACRGDPYTIDTLMIFMANMAWNSSMNTTDARQLLCERDEKGEYKIPFLVVCDAFESEMTAFADLILPDTTYLERHDVMSMLDRPISEFDGPVDSVRVPILPPSAECRPFQEVLIELAGRLKFPAFVNDQGERKFKNYPDFIVNFQTEPNSGQGFLIGWRGKDADQSMVGAPNPDQWAQYEKNNCFYQHRLPLEQQYMRNWNQGYNQWAVTAKLRRYPDPVMIQLYAEVLQRFRLAARGHGERQPPESLRERIETYFDPLPFYYEPLESATSDKQRYPLSAITQRPMAMYHSWDSQNAWLRQIHAHNFLFVNTQTALAAGIADGQWMWVESAHGKVRCLCRHSQSVEPGTVWTWNAIGKAQGAWHLAENANESQKGFLLNHLLKDEILDSRGRLISNSDPITGQAGWYDVKVSIRPAKADEKEQSFPQFKSMAPLPGRPRIDIPSQAYVAGKVHKK
jgi:anaerobic selenocysteine-containing dehydrogenase